MCSNAVTALASRLNRSVNSDFGTFGLRGFGDRRDHFVRPGSAPGYTEAFATMNFVRFRAPCNGRLQTPPGLEGSNGSGLPRVPRITRSLAYEFEPRTTANERPVRSE
jgi:hypothetical protein